MAANTILNNERLNPDFIDFLNDLKRDIFLNLNCHGIAVVDSVDYDNQRLTAKMAYKKSIIKKQDDKFVQRLQPYPTLVDMPFISLRGDKGGLNIPPQPGDECLVFFNDRCLDDWYQSGSVNSLSSNRLHSMSDGIALVGLGSMSNLIKNYDPTKVTLYYGNTKVSLGEKIKISNDSQDLKSLLQELVQKVTELANLNGLS